MVGTGLVGPPCGGAGGWRIKRWLLAAALWRTPPGGEGVQDKFAAVNIPPIAASRGSPAERVAIGMRNALTFDLHNGGRPMPPVYALKVYVGTTQFTAYLDPATGRPDTQIEIVRASYQLVELATGKTVVNDATSVHVDYDIPGSQQRFAGQRARRDAEDRALQEAADMSATALRRTSWLGREQRLVTSLTQIWRIASVRTSTCRSFSTGFAYRLVHFLVIVERSPFFLQDPPPNDTSPHVSCLVDLVSHRAPANFTRTRLSVIVQPVSSCNLRKTLTVSGRSGATTEPNRRLA